jgi:molybdate transport system ATP-binding protein
MIEARIVRRFPPGSESAGFTLDVEFQADSGCTVLFGPSGAGKTLILDSIAGFARPDSGRIQLDGQILFDASARICLRPQDRNCGYVFQNYALFPHMTLRENLAFAAERRPRLERHRRVNEMIERFHLGGVAGRKPHEVSGGEKQRCSIARALIGAPRLLLLDEPARGLDAPLRAELYSVLRQVRAGFDVPVLLVTHDLDECFELAGSMLVLSAGRLVQSGPPLAVLSKPANADVARLLGLANVFEAAILALDPGRNTSRLRAGAFELSGPYMRGHLRGDRVWLCVDPAALRVGPATVSRAGVNQLIAQVRRVTELPRTARIEFTGGLTAEIPRDEYLRQKDNKDWLIEFPPGSIRLL